ncbi:MAG: DNA polymerase [bacterium]|nr:DNA polymerase [bacterium]
MPAHQKRLIVIDANSLIHRAFHALPPLSTRKGELVNAVYGFLLVLFKVLKELHPEYAVACFDVPSPTKRKQQFAFYKANRVKGPDELYSQMPRVKEALEKFHIPIYEKEGFEADDLIGTIAKLSHLRQAHPPLEVVIISGDMDTLQLVDKGTKVYTMRKGLQDTVLYDEKRVQERFGGLRPNQLADYKGLRGDPSDNIPGVRGVGEKTAIQLLQEYGSVEGVYKNVGSIKGTLGTKLKESKEDAFLSKELGTVDTNVPIDFQLQGCEWKGYDPEEAKQFLQNLGFQSLMNKLPETSSVSQTGALPGILQEIEQLYAEKILPPELYELEKRLIPVIDHMEKTGIKIDKKYFASLSKEMRAELKKLEAKITKEAKGSFTINSPKQLSEVLFSRLKLPLKGIKKTSGGMVSTASPELEKLEALHSIIPLLISYRELQKILTTYVKPLPLMTDSAGRIHTTFHQLGAATGRMSSSDPNLQNIPVQGTWGKRIREGFIAEKGYTFLSLDYSQTELRIASHLAKDPMLEEAFRKGEDIHRVTASTVFGVSPEAVTKEMRNRAKALNFGILYGMGPQGFAKSAKISLEEAQDFIASYFARFPSIQRFMEDTKAFARTYGYAETLFKRRRYLPDIYSTAPQLKAAAERMAINHPIQGTNADLMKMAMVEIYDAIVKNNPECRLLLQIHDELLFECKEKNVHESLPRIKEKMEDVGKASGLLLKVEAKEGPNWGSMRPVIY